MMKQITPEFALAASFTPFKYLAPTSKDGEVLKDKTGKTIYELRATPRFIKQGETQAAATKRLMRSDKFITKQKAPTRMYPAFIPGVTTTADYVRTYEGVNHLSRNGLTLKTNLPSPVPTDDTVQFEEANDHAEDLV